MDHGWVTVNYNVARCSLIIVPVESSRVGVTTRRRLIKYTYPREGSALVRKKKTTSLDSLKFASLVLQVHKDWILARSTTEQAWSAVRPPQIRTPQRACRAHKTFYLSSQVEPRALWVKALLESNLVQSSCKWAVRSRCTAACQRQPIGISLGLFLSRPFEPQPTGRIDFGFRRSKRRRTRSLVWSTFRSNFFKRFSSTDSFVILLSHGIKKWETAKNSIQGGILP